MADNVTLGALKLMLSAPVQKALDEAIGRDAKFPAKPTTQDLRTLNLGLAPGSASQREWARITRALERVGTEDVVAVDKSLAEGELAVKERIAFKRVAEPVKEPEPVKPLVIEPVEPVEPVKPVEPEKPAVDPKIAAAAQTLGVPVPQGAWLDFLKPYATGAAQLANNAVIQAEPSDEAVNAVRIALALGGKTQAALTPVGDAATLDGHDVRAFFYGSVKVRPAVKGNLGVQNATLIVKNPESLPEAFQGSLTRTMPKGSSYVPVKDPNAQAPSARNVHQNVVFISRMDLAEEARAGRFNQELYNLVAQQKHAVGA